MGRVRRGEEKKEAHTEAEAEQHQSIAAVGEKRYIKVEKSK